MLSRAILACVLLLPVLSWAAPARDSVDVFVTVAPLAWLVKGVGGERVRVQSLVRPGQDPHGFEPSPRQLAALQQADAYLSLDLPFERVWLPRVAGQQPRLRIVHLGAEIHEPGHGQEGVHAHADHDPHQWTDPLRMQVLSEQVRDLLVELLPGAAAEFRGRQAGIATRLRELHGALRERFAAMQPKVFLVHHPAWGHLAARYGLTQLAVEQGGKEPGPKALAALSAAVRHHGITTLFVEPQASDHLARSLADALSLQIVPLDPLAADYDDNLRRVAEQIAGGVR